MKGIANYELTDSATLELVGPEGGPLTFALDANDIDEETGRVEIDLTVNNEAGETRVFGTATVCISGPAL